MNRVFLHYDPNQSLLLAPNLREWLPPDHLAYFISDVVDNMDLTPFFKHYDSPEGGAPPHHPTMMVKLVLYGYATGTAASRRIAQATEENVAFRILAAGNHPDFRCISDFRKNHIEDLKALFKQVLKLCRESGLAKLGVVSLDGTKVKANASLAKNRKYETLVEEEKRLEDEIHEALMKGVKVDEEDDRKYGRDMRGDELPKELRTRKDRLERIRQAKAELERKAVAEAQKQEEKLEERKRKEEEQGQKLRGRKPNEPDSKVASDAKANTTDPESRIMKTSKGFVQAYNGQAVVDIENQIIVACGLTQEENDFHQLNPMLSRTIENVGQTPGAGLGDAGYWTEEEIKNAPPDIELYIATTKDWKQRKALREMPPPRGRIPKDMSLRDRMERKLLTKKGRQLYKKRGSTVEPVFGQIKARGGDRFLLRGTDKADGEWSLYCTTHNLLKLQKSGRWKGLLT